MGPAEPPPPVRRLQGRRERDPGHLQLVRPAPHGHLPDHAFHAGGVRAVGGRHQCTHPPPASPGRRRPPSGLCLRPPLPPPGGLRLGRGEHHLLRPGRPGPRRGRCALRRLAGRAGRHGLLERLRPCGGPQPRQ